MLKQEQEEDEKEGNKKKGGMIEEKINDQKWKTNRKSNVNGRKIKKERKKQKEMK